MSCIFYIKTRGSARPLSQENLKKGLEKNSPRRLIMTTAMGLGLGIALVAGLLFWFVYNKTKTEV